ncbi:MAG: EF-P lysine aminoacylase EpmA [Xanthomonadales bacterium]|nr:EF-P lysine aminoacylase EpmA [Xanthomonadales bacterium]
MSREDWRPTASRQALEARAKLLDSIRAFFSQRGIVEVETPVLSAASNSDPNIASIHTDDTRPRYLRTSPEYPMKRLLASGSGDIFELGRVFRAGESGRHHNPEFTMAEWYRVGMGYLDLADEVVALVRHCGRDCSELGFDSWPLNRLTFQQLFQAYAGIDPFQCDESELAMAAEERGLAAPRLSHSEYLDLLMAEVIQPALPGETFTVVHDFPPEQAALSRVRDGNPAVAERFEVFAGQQELANGYQELTDAAEQRKRFERERRQRSARGEPEAPLDERLLAALEHGLPECSGVALGVDRLLMLMLNVDDIRTVLAFPYDRA